MGGTKTGMARMTAAAIAIVLGMWVSPAIAGLVPLSDEEMDGVTAAGDSTVLASGDLSPVTYTDNSLYSLTFAEPNAQSGLTALSIQNVVGELQLLVNLNVLAAANNVASTDQRNFSLQSWGGTLPIADTVKTVNGVAAAPTACTADNSCNGNGGNSTGGTGGNAAVGGNGGNSGSGGSGSVTVGNASSSPGAVSQAASASGDLVVTSGSGSPITVTDDSTYNLTFAVSQAQSDLSALFVSNVVGTSQMALNLNIASSTFTTVPFQASAIGGNVTGTIKQVNTGIQFRGTPLVGATGVTTGINMTINHTNQ